MRERGRVDIGLGCVRGQQRIVPCIGKALIICPVYSHPIAGCGKTAQGEQIAVALQGTPAISSRF